MHPFQLIWDGTQVSVQRGLVIDVQNARAFDVEGATVDLRFDKTEVFFPPEENIYLQIDTQDPSGVDPNRSARVLSASLSSSPGPGGINIGKVENGIVNQNISSDFYIFIPGTQTV